MEDKKQKILNDIVEKTCIYFSEYQVNSSSFIKSKYVFCDKSNSYEIFKSVAEIPEETEIYMAYVEKGKVTVLTDEGIHILFEGNRISKDWETFAKERFGLSEGKIRSGNQLIGPGEKDLFLLLKKIREDMRMELGLDQDPVLEAEDNVEEKILQKIREKVNQAAMEASSPVHIPSCKRRIRELSYYMDLEEKFDLPEEIEIYYLYHTNMGNDLLVTEYGIYLNEEDKTFRIPWKDVPGITLKQQPDSKEFVIGDHVFHADLDENFLFHLLLILRDTVEKAVYAVPGLNYRVIRPELDYKSLFKNLPEVSVTEGNQKDLAEEIERCSPVLEDILGRINEEGAGTGRPECLISWKEGNLYILITERYFIKTDKEGNFCVPLEALITVRMTEQCVVILYDSEYGIREERIHLTDRLSKADLRPFIINLQNKYPYMQAVYYTKGSGVPKDLEKARELYLKALEKGDCPEGAAFFLGFLYEKEGEPEKAEQYYQKALEYKSRYRLAAAYNLALLIYTRRNTDFETDRHLKALYYMDVAARRDFKKAGKHMKEMLEDSRWCEEAEKEARKAKCLPGYYHLVLRKGMEQAVSPYLDKVRDLRGKKQQ